MKSSTKIVTGVILFASCIGAYYFIANRVAGDVYKGQWDQQYETSIRFLSGWPLKVQFCWEGACSNHKPRGNASEMTFVWVKTDSYPGGTIVFKKDGQVYRGEYQVVGNTQIQNAILRKVDGS